MLSIDFKWSRPQGGVSFRLLLTLTGAIRRLFS
jgi:hypothetical protein